MRNHNCRYNLLKATRTKRLLTYRGKPIRISSDLSTKTWQARKGWQDIFRALNEKNMQPRILYPARLTFKMDGEIKFPRPARLQRLRNRQADTAGNIKGGYINEEKSFEEH